MWHVVWLNVNKTLYIVFVCFCFVFCSIFSYFTGLKNYFIINYDLAVFDHIIKTKKKDSGIGFQSYILLSFIHNLLVNEDCGNLIKIVLPRPKQNCHCTACCKKIVKYSSAKLKSVSNSMFIVATYLVPKSEIKFKLITALSIYDTFSKRWFLFWLCFKKFHTFHLLSRLHSQS